MKLTTQMARRTARAMKRAAHEGCDPRNTSMQQAKVYQRLWTDDQRREAARATSRPMRTTLRADREGWNIWDIEGDLR